MKSPGKIISYTIVALTLLTFMFFIYDFYLPKNSIAINHMESQILSTIEFQEKNILDYFEEKKVDLEDISNIDYIRNVFKKNITSKEFVVKRDVTRSSKVILKEIENYILFNPQITLKDLQNNLEFERIVTQKISKNGYSLIYDSESGETLFHPNKNFVGNNLSTLEEISGDFYNQSIKIIEGGEDYAEGAYILTDPLLGPKEKFATHQRIPIKTKDGHEFVLASTVYMDDYKVLKNLDLELEKSIDDIIKVGGYHGFYIINKEGFIIYDDEADGYLGSNIFEVDSSVSNIFKSTMNHESPIIIGPHFEEHKKDLIVFSIGLGLYEGGEFLGSIILQFPAGDIYNFLLEETPLSKYGETYLVDSYGYLASPIKFVNGDILIQEISSEDFYHCKSNSSIETNEDIVISENYIGDKVLSGHKYINDLCLITNVLYYESIVLPQNKEGVKKLIYLSILFVFIIFVLKFIQVYIDSRYQLIKRSKFKYFKLKNKYPKIITPRMAALFGVIIVIGGIFILSKLNGYFYSNIYKENIMDLIVILISFVLIGVAFKIKDLSAKNFLFFGALIIIFEKCVEVIVQTIDMLQSQAPSLEIWLPIYIIKYSGLIIIVEGFFRGIRK